MTLLKSICTMLTLIVLTSSCSKENDIYTNNNIDCASKIENHKHAVSLQSLIDGYTNEGFVGLTLLVDQPNDGLWMGASGFASIEEDNEMNACHLNHAASIYKSYIATIIMQLVEEGKVKLDEKLTDYLSSDITNRLPNGSVVSIKNLLQHRSGIPDIFEVEFLTDFFNDPTRQYTIVELLEYVYDKKPLSDIDTEFYYSDANFSLLSLVIEKVEGNFIDALKDRIFLPLGLEDTYFLEDMNQVPAGIADSYWDRYGNGAIENNTNIQIALATGLVTSADNLKTFIQALASGQLVTDISPMINFIDVPKEIQQERVYSGYGMGLMKVQISGEQWYGHFGNHIGSGAIVLYNADKDLTVVALTNTGTFFSDNIQSKFFYQLLNDIEAIYF